MSTGTESSRKIGFGENGTYRKIDAGTHQFDLGIDTRDEGYRQVFTAERTFEGEQAYTAIALGHAETEAYDTLLLTDTPVEASST